MKLILNKIIKFIKSILIESWFFYDPNFEIKGEKWSLHKCDADQNFPSVPHMDCITDARKKMNIYTGEIFINKKYLTKATKKDIKRLWDDMDFRKNVYAERKRYLKQYGKEYKENIPEKYFNEYNDFINKK